MTLGPPRDLTGSILGGRYRVLRLLGAGGMGAVYEAVQEGLGRRVAVKVIYDELAYHAEAIERFRREAQAAAALGHPNIVQVTDFQLGPPPFLVMELLHGASLQKLVAEQGALPVARVLGIAAQVLSALGAAHGAGLVHRDIKPDNVFVTATAANSDLVKVLDFGIVKQIGAPGSERLTATGAMVGSPAFMAPEQVRGRAVDARTDLYAVGVCMYIALTGRMPFSTASLPELVFAIDEKSPPPIAAVRGDVPPGVAQIVERAMAKEPAARFASAAEMLAALAPWLGGASLPGMAPPSPSFAASPAARSVVATPSPVLTGGIRQAPPAPAQSAAGAPPPPAPTKPMRGLVAFWIALGSMVLVVLGLGAATIWIAHSADASSKFDAAALVTPSGGDAAPIASAVPSATSTTRDAAPGAVMPRDAAAAPPAHPTASGPVAPPAPPAPSIIVQEDAGALPQARSAGRTIIQSHLAGPYNVEHINYVTATFVARADACVQRVPTSDFTPGTLEHSLSEVFVVTVNARGQVTSISHPTDDYLRAFDACMRPLIQGAPWGKTANPGEMKLAVTSHRKAR